MKVTTDGCLFGAWAAATAKKCINEGEGNKGRVNPTRVIDIGTGTGLLSLMFAQQHPMTQVDAVEIDEQAYGQAVDNVAASKFSKLIQVHHVDIRQFQTAASYPVIISNPPFYESQLESGNLEKDVAHHGKGLLLTELLLQVQRLLSPSGHFFVLLPFYRYQELREEAAKVNLYVNYCVFVRPLAGSSPSRCMLQLGADSQLPARREELVIEQTRGTYTAEFTALLKDYYLKL